MLTSLLPNGTAGICRFEYQAFKFSQRAFKTSVIIEPENPLVAEKCELIHTFSGASYHRF